MAAKTCGLAAGGADVVGVGVSIGVVGVDGVGVLDPGVGGMILVSWVMQVFARTAISVSVCEQTFSISEGMAVEEVYLVLLVQSYGLR